MISEGPPTYYENDGSIEYIDYGYLFIYRILIKVD